MFVTVFAISQSEASEPEKGMLYELFGINNSKKVENRMLLERTKFFFELGFPNKKPRLKIKKNQPIEELSIQEKVDKIIHERKNKKKKNTQRKQPSIPNPDTKKLIHPVTTDSTHTNYNVFGFIKF